MGNTNKKALLVIAHGSRVENSNLEIKELSEAIQKSFDKNHKRVKVSFAFLELGKPSIEESIKELVEAGFLEITTYCHFLTAGRHIRDDIPLRLKKISNEYSQLKVNSVSYLGAWGISESEKKRPPLYEYIVNSLENEF